MKSQFKFTRANGTSHKVGQFFEILVRNMLEGEDCEPEQGDFVRWDTPSFFAEVKASDNTHPFRLPKFQFVEQEVNLGFLFSHHVHILCKYKNKEGRRKSTRRRLSLIKKLKTTERIHAFLAQNDLRIHILHRSVIEAVEKHFYSQRELPLGLDGESVIEIRHKTLEKFSHPAYSRAWLKNLNLRSMKVKNLLVEVPYQVGFLTIKTHIKVTTVLPQGLSEKVSLILLPLMTEEAHHEKTEAA